MTEAEWLACDSTGAMLELLGPKLGRRKELLLGVACCQRLGDLLDGTCRATLSALERHAESPLPEVTCSELWQEIRNHAYDLFEEIDTPLGYARYLATGAVRQLVLDYGQIETDYFSSAEYIKIGISGVVSQATEAISVAQDDSATFDLLAYEERYDPAERAAQVILLRCITGNPFRPVTFSPSWRTSTVVALAAQMYESRDFGAMPILADALQDAGCDSADVLDHCRGPGPHVRGCWVVDLVLGKE